MLVVLEDMSRVISKKTAEGESSLVSSGCIPAAKVYKKPSLTVHGKIAELTGGVNGTNFDPGHNNSTKKGIG